MIWIRDWSQKILPQKFREPQDYFGKKGYESTRRCHTDKAKQ